MRSFADCGCWVATGFLLGDVLPAGNEDCEGKEFGECFWCLWWMLDLVSLICWRVLSVFVRCVVLASEW